VYLDDLARTLAEVSLERRLAFALFCCDPLVGSVSIESPDALRQPIIAPMQSIVAACWAEVAGLGPPDRPALVEASHSLAGADWEDSVFHDPLREVELEEAVEAALALSEVAQTGSSMAAAQVAERVINVLDFAFAPGVSSLNSHPITASELKRQRAILAWTTGEARLTEDLRIRFRRSYVGLPARPRAGA